MRNKLFKLGAVLLAVFQLVGMTAFASITSPEDSDYYWYEDFNGEAHSLQKQAAMTATRFTRSGTNQGIELKSSVSENNFAYVNFEKLDFSKPIIISYDVITTSATDMWLDVCFGSNGTALAKLARLRANLTVEGYEYNSADTTGALVMNDDGTVNYAKNAAYGTKATTSAAKYATGKAINVLASLDYDKSTEILTIKQYFDGNPLLKQDGSQYEYKIKRNDMDTDMSSSIALRFYVLKNTSARIDNIMVRQEGNIDIPNGSWISSNQTAVTFEKDFVYKISDSSELDKSTYKVSFNTLAKADCEVKKYTDDPFLLEGVDYTGYSLTNYGGSSVFGGLALSDVTKDFYILKIKNKDAVKSWAGKPITNQYALLHGGLTFPTLVRETHIYDASGNEIFVTGGKFPYDAKRVVFTLTTKVDNLPDESDVKIGDVTSTKNGNVYTVDFSGNYLEQGTEYEIQVGDLKKSYTTTGTKPANPYATAHLQTFDDSVPFTNTNSNIITLTNENGRILYKNTAETGTKTIAYNFDEGFDFTKGSMLVSFDVTLNQKIEWVSDSTKSYLFMPQMKIGSGQINMPVIEHWGIRAMYNGSRTRTTDAKDTMKTDDKVTISTLATYYPDTDKIGYIQFADGRRLYDYNTKEIIPKQYIDNASSFIGGNACLNISGRNFKDGGLYIDNLMMTTVDGITAGDVLSVVNKTAAVNVKSTVAFADGTNAALTNPIFTNNAGRDDFSINKYAKDDKLRLKGTLTNDVTYDKGTFTFGTLDETYDYVVKLNDASKVKCINDKAIDNVYFTTAAAGSILKTTVLDAGGNELTVDSAGKVPSNAAKIKIRFTKDNDDITDVSIGSLKATLEDGEYVFDFGSAPLDANTNYELKVNNETYGSFTTTDGAMTVNTPVISADGTTSVFIQNTTTGTPFVYIISATYDSNGAMVDVVYDKFTVQKGNDTYTLTSTPDRGTGAVTQKAFVWDGFTELNPYCAEASVTISGN